MMRAQFGDFASVRVGPKRILFLADPDAIGDVLQDKEERFAKNEVSRAMSEFLGQGLLTSDGELWKRQRRLMSPSLSRKHLETYAASMTRRASEYADSLAPGEVRDVHADMTRVTLQVVLDTLFGEELGVSVEHVGRVMNDLMHGFEELANTWRRFFPSWTPFPARRKLAQATRDLEAIVMDVLARKRARGEGALGDDLMARLMAARDDDGQGMSDAQVRDEALTVFLAGHETTANALAFALHLLAENPKVAERVRAEAIAAAREGQPLGLADVPRLRVTEAAFKESLRLFPPAYYLGREALRDLELRGHPVAKGTEIVIAPWAMQRDARFWDEPAKFDPDRWLDGRADRAPKNAYIPFGAGPRTCLGNHFAMLEGTLVLGTIVPRWGFEPVPGERIDLQAAVTLRPRGGLRLRTVPR
jgi:cytochrome P450